MFATNCLSLSELIMQDEQILKFHKADSRCAPSQWETVLLSNDVSHWLGTNLAWALFHENIFNSSPPSAAYMREAGQHWSR